MDLHQVINHVRVIRGMAYKAQCPEVSNVVIPLVVINMVCVQQVGVLRAIHPAVFTNEVLLAPDLVRDEFPIFGVGAIAFSLFRDAVPLIIDKPYAEPASPIVAVEVVNALFVG